MNPHYTPGSLFLTPRAPNGKRLPARARHHMRGSETERELPEEDKDGRFQGKAEFEGEPHGKPKPPSVEFQVNSNDKFREPLWYSDPLGAGRKKVDPEEVARERERDKLRKQRADQAAKAAQAAKSGQQAQQPSKWKFTASPASSQRVPGL